MSQVVGVFTEEEGLDEHGGDRRLSSHLTDGLSRVESYVEYSSAQRLTKQMKAELFDPDNKYGDVGRRVEGVGANMVACIGMPPKYIVKQANGAVKEYYRGNINEANSVIGIVRTYTKTSELITLDTFLGSIQNELFDLGAELSTPKSNQSNSLSIVEKQVDRIEQEIDQLNINLESLRSFVLPGGTPASSYLHLARTVIRRAERLMVQLSLTEKDSVSDIALKYVNRLSDLCFVAARYANQTDQGGQGDTLWRPGETNINE